LEQLHLLLLLQPDFPPFEIFEDAQRSLPSETFGARAKSGRFTLHIGLDGVANEEIEQINSALDKENGMPWLVPACSLEELNTAVDLVGAGLFQGAKIAGLVPGVGNASFDACAYLWDVGAPLAWAIEFKARSDDYPLNTAMSDLQAKCDTGLPESGGNAMLVGISGTSICEARVWLAGDDLRIVLLVGCKLFG
jgi:hypothetical protein